MCVLKLVENRAGTAVPESAPNQERNAPVVNILDALRKSLDEIRTPAKSESPKQSSRKRDKHRPK